MNDRLVMIMPVYKKRILCASMTYLHTWYCRRYSVF